MSMLTIHEICNRCFELYTFLEGLCNRCFELYTFLEGLYFFSREFSYTVCLKKIKLRILTNGSPLSEISML